MIYLEYLLSKKINFPWFYEEPIYSKSCTKGGKY